MSYSVGRDDSSSKTETKDIVPSHLQWLKTEAPGFSLNGDQIKVILNPKEFYSAVIKGCQGATRRIALATCYIGKGDLEHKLVEVLDGRMTECGEDLSVTVLLDAVRGTRDESAGTVLLPLIRKHQHCQVALFHSPELRGVKLNWLPTRINEVVGVQHIKLYVFDDDVIISGANLNEDYFTNRQDRYLYICQCASMADFCCGLIKKLCSVSFQLRGDDSLEAPSPHLHPYLSPAEVYVKYAREIVWGYYQKALKDAEKQLKPGDDTWIFPVLQLPPLGVMQDSRVTQQLIECAQRNSQVYFSSPYFNLPEIYIDSLLLKCEASLNLLIPHPTALNFHGSAGLAVHVPVLYKMIANEFHHRVQDTGQAGRVSIQEFSQPEQTYHCKGMWLTEPGQHSPYLTVIGSSNFNYRSVERDLECQMVLVTGNPALSLSLHEEYEHVYKNGAPYDEDVFSVPNIQPTIWHRLFLWFTKTYL